MANLKETDMKNPFKKGTMSYDIWERNNNPNDKQFLRRVLTGGKITERDEKILKESLAT